MGLLTVDNTDHHIVALNKEIYLYQIANFNSWSQDPIEKQLGPLYIF